MRRVSILGIPVDCITQAGAVERILSFLKQQRCVHIATPNNEMLVEAQKNAAFAEVLRNTDVNLPDSTGVVCALRIQGCSNATRVTGVDTVEQVLLNLSSDHPVFFLGGRGGVGARAAKYMQQRNRQLVVAGTYEGSPSEKDAEDILRRITASGAHLLLVAYGAPSQDLWIAQYHHRLPNIRVAIGVGGTFDFLAGTIQRAPRIVRSVHLEWLWRLILQPWRWKRIWNAVVLFPLILLRSFIRR